MKTIKIPDNIHQELKIKAAKENKTLVEVIMEYLDKEEEKNRVPAVAEKNTTPVPPEVLKFENEKEEKKSRDGLVKERGEINSDDYI